LQDMIHHRKEIGVLIMTVMIASILLSSAACAPHRALSELDDDVLYTEKGYESIVFWRLRVQDKTGTISSRPRMAIYHSKDTKEMAQRFDSRTGETLMVDGGWTKQEGLSRFDSLVYTAARPDEYLFKEINFFMYTVRHPNYWSAGRSEEQDIYFTVPLHRRCTVPAGKLVYLGEIVVDFLKEEKSRYSYRVSVIQDETDLNNATKEFREAYPGLFKRFNKTVEKAAWKVYLVDQFASNENGWAVPASDKHVHAQFRDKKYMIQSKNDDCHVAGMSPSFGWPQQFDLELVSARTSDGVNAQDHGFLFGPDRDNGYYVLVSATGQARIDLYKEGEVRSAPIPSQIPSTGTMAQRKVDRQRMEVRGDVLRYYVNDQFIGEIKNEFDMKAWSFGLTVCGRQTVAFDQLTLIEQ
jgi:hypothetical protein